MLVSSGLALLFLPGARSMALAGWRRGATRVLGWAGRLRRAGRQGVQQASGSGWRALGDLRGGLVQNRGPLLAALAVLLLLPLLAVSWRQWVQIDTFDHTDVHIRDDRVAALLAGERLVPPSPLPPELFSTRELEQVRPTVRYASRDWALLDADFAQRLLLVFRLMRERHGYDMVLIEGYRSPQRQEQLAAMGGHVTRVGAFRSYHQFGLAADSAFMRDGVVVVSERDPWVMRGYELYGELAASLGLTWGGGWHSLKDYGHVELRRPGVLKRADGDAQPGAGYEF